MGLSRASEHRPTAVRPADCPLPQLPQSTRHLQAGCTAFERPTRQGIAFASRAGSGAARTRVSMWRSSVVRVLGRWASTAPPANSATRSGQCASHRSSISGLRNRGHPPTSTRINSRIDLFGPCSRTNRVVLRRPHRSHLRQVTLSIVVKAATSRRVWTLRGAAAGYRARNLPSYRIARHGRGVGLSVACQPNGGATEPLGLNGQVRLLGHLLSTRQLGRHVCASKNERATENRTCVLS